jgi:hypothetical protein
MCIPILRIVDSLIRNHLNLNLFSSLNVLVNKPIGPDCSDPATAIFACTNSSVLTGKHAEGKEQILWNYKFC